MPSSNSTLYQVSVCGLFFGYKDNELKLLVRMDEDERIYFPEQDLQADGSLQEAVRDMADTLLLRDDYYTRQIGADDPEEDYEGTHRLNVMYYVLTQWDNLKTEETDEQPYQWIALKGANLTEEQKNLVEKALKRIRRKIGISPIAFHMLPGLFTLSQLQHLYELILDSPVDKRNFRKRVCEMNYIQQTEMIDKSSSKRGAHLYAFNRDMFRRSRIVFKL